MATTPVPVTGFWAHLKQLLPAIELAGNVALLASGVGAPFEPLVASLEAAVNPALQSIGTPQTASTTILTIYATIIGVLTTLKATPGLPAATLAEIDGYVVAAQAGTSGYIQAQSGFDPNNYKPVEPIA
ncbi:MAG TPA: hypothetical protein VN666_22025 [Nitrospira sp.]|nr:hypothetical protein [Nitrospira sp.]